MRSVARSSVAFVLLAGSALAGDPLTDARALLEREKLLAAGCPDETRELATWFGTTARRGVQSATTAVVVPAPLPDVAAWILQPSRWPEWLLVSPDGAPNLAAVSHDAETGRTAVSLLGSSDGEQLEGTLAIRRENGEAVASLSLEAGSPFKFVKIELAALKCDCADTAIGVMTLTWKLGALARMFGGAHADLPTLFALRVRQDLVAQALSSPEALARVVASHPVEPGTELLHAMPIAFLASPGIEGRLAEHARSSGRSSMKDTLELFWDAARGLRAYRGYDLLTESGDVRQRVLAVGATKGDLRHAVSVALSDEESSLGIELGRAWPGAVTPADPVQGGS